LTVGVLSEWSASDTWVRVGRLPPVLRVIRGGDWARFSVVAQRLLFQQSFTVTPDADRMGVRLDGPKLERVDHRDLLSEPVAPGVIQVPPAGAPIILLGDCQTVGGYPKIAHVISIDLPIAAQLRPGDEVRFIEVSLADAHRLLMQRADELRLFRIGLDLRVE
jgi:antagonist of KipI